MSLNNTEHPEFSRDGSTDLEIIGNEAPVARRTRARSVSVEPRDYVADSAAAAAAAGVSAKDVAKRLAGGARKSRSDFATGGSRPTTRSLSASRASSAAPSPRWSPEPEDILGVEALPPSGRGSPVSSAKGSPREAERRAPSGRRSRSVSVVSVYSDAEYGETRTWTRSRSRAASEEPRAAPENPEAAKPA